jgi:hypothetical protein
LTSILCTDIVKQSVHVVEQFAFGYEDKTKGGYLTRNTGLDIWKVIDRDAIVMESDLESIARRTLMLGVALNKSYLRDINRT